MILQLNPTIDVKTPLGDCEAMFLIDYGVNVNTVWVCRMAGGDVKHFYSDDIKVYDSPMNGKGWDVEENESYLKNFMANWPPSLETASYPWTDPKGKWSTPPDHPDNGGALIGQDKEKWKEINSEWVHNPYEPNLIEYLDKHYQPPKRFNLDSWTKVQNWCKSLVDYKDTLFLDFLIKFYPAPDPKK